VPQETNSSIDVEVGSLLLAVFEDVFPCSQLRESNSAEPTGLLLPDLLIVCLGGVLTLSNSAEGGGNCLAPRSSCVAVWTPLSVFDVGVFFFLSLLLFCLLLGTTAAGCWATVAKSDLDGSSLLRAECNAGLMLCHVWTFSSWRRLAM
jgi:hypothetical protein